MSESLRNDGRIWVPQARQATSAPPDQIPEAERDYYLERRYPSFGNLVPRDVASRNAKAVCDEGRGVGETGLGVYLDFADAISAWASSVIAERYGNLFEMYERITDENPYKVPMRIYPAIHYTMGGLWVDYHLMSTIPGLFVLGEANFSDHGANRLGASALMQGLSDGYFVIPYTMAITWPRTKLEKVDADASRIPPATPKRTSTALERLLSIKGKRTVDSFHRELGKIMWDHCGMSRNAAGLEARHRPESARCANNTGATSTCLGARRDLNQQLEKAGRVADFFELGRTDVHRRPRTATRVLRRPLPRGVSDPEDGEALRDDEHFHMSPPGNTRARPPPQLNKEPLEFDYVHPAQRSYK